MIGGLDPGEKTQGSSYRFIRNEILWRDIWVVPQN